MASPPEILPPLVEEGLRLQQNARWAEAEAALRRALERSPELMTARLALCDALIQQGKAAQVAALLPDGVLTQAAPKEKLRAFADLGRLSELFDCAAALVRADRSPKTLELVCWPWQWVWPDQGRAASFFKDLAAELDRRVGGAAPPDKPWPSYYRALVRRRALHDDRWKDDLLPLFALEPAEFGWLRLELGRAFLYEGELEKAVACFDAYVAYASGEDWSARCYAAEACAYLRREDEALARFDRAVAAAEPELKKEPLCWKGNILLWLGRLEEAVATLEKAEAAGARYAPCWLGAAKLRLGDAQAALPELSRAVELKPFDGEAWVWRGEARRLLKERDGALADFAKAIEINDNPWAYANRALIDDSEADYEKARAQLPLPEAKTPTQRLAGLTTLFLESPAIRDPASYARWTRHPPRGG